MRSGLAAAGSIPLGRKLLLLNWPLVLLLCAICGVGVVMLYSAGHGSWEPWAARHLARFGAALALMFAVALVDIRFWLRHAYTVYGTTLLLLIAVEVAGFAGMGARRWLDLGMLQLQPSELMKIALVLALARHFCDASIERIRRSSALIAPLLLAGAPAALVLRQPDLGTAIMLLMGAAAVLFVVGVPLWKFAAAGLLLGAALPALWFLLEAYQRRRILIFFHPESDPLGAGYHILQAMIALGSGGVSGKGYLHGTQSHLNFLPERQTDFIFTMLAEEFGLIGGLGLLLLFCILFVYSAAISLRIRNQFGRVLGLGIAVTVALYGFINIAMVMGLVPVVGVPLPLISYGGTVMLSVMAGFGLLLSASIHRDVEVGRAADLGAF